MCKIKGRKRELKIKTKEEKSTVREFIWRGASVKGWHKLQCNECCIQKGNRLDRLCRKLCLKVEEREGVGQKVLSLFIFLFFNLLIN